MHDEAMLATFSKARCLSMYGERCLSRLDVLATWYSAQVNADMSELRRGVARWDPERGAFVEVVSALPIESSPIASALASSVQVQVRCTQPSTGLPINDTHLRNVT